jgi:hypothetical protein
LIDVWFVSDISAVSHRKLDGIGVSVNAIAKKQIGKSIFKFLQIRIDLTFLVSDDHRQEVHTWLKSPDQCSNHDAARKKRQAETGNWFLEGDQFVNWKRAPSSVLWLHGIRSSSYQPALYLFGTNQVHIAGCGKTILW